MKRMKIVLCLAPWVILLYLATVQVLRMRQEREDIRFLANTYVETFRKSGRVPEDDLQSVAEDVAKMQYYGTRRLDALLDDLTADVDLSNEVLLSLVDWYGRTEGLRGIHWLQGHMLPDTYRRFDDAMKRVRTGLCRAARENGPTDDVLRWLANFRGDEVEEIFLSALDSPDPVVSVQALAYVVNVIAPRCEDHSEIEDLRRLLREREAKFASRSDLGRENYHVALSILGDKASLRRLSELAGTSKGAFIELGSCVDHPTAIELANNPDLALELEYDPSKKRFQRSPAARPEPSATRER